VYYNQFCLPQASFMSFTSVLLVAASLLCTTALSAQVKQDGNGPHPEIFARLAYNESGQRRPVCVAVATSGYYRAILTVNGRIQRLQGKMPTEQFNRLRALLSAPDFRALPGAQGGLLRQHAESFGAEVFHSDAGDSGNTVFNRLRTQRLEWLNPDDENPFPAPVLKVVRWLKDFKPPNAQNFLYSEFPDVCPSVGLRLLRPSIASSHAP